MIKEKEHREREKHDADLRAKYEESLYRNYMVSHNDKMRTLTVVGLTIAGMTAATAIAALILKLVMGL